MKTDNIYIAYNNKENGCLVKEESKICREYRNMITNKIYFDFQIRQFVGINNLIDVKKNETKRNIIKKYIEYKEELLNLEDIFIGNLDQIIDVEIKKDKFFLELYTTEHKLSFKTKTFKINVILKRESPYVYNNIVTGEKYNNMHINVGKIYIPNNFLIPICQDLQIMETRLERYKVLELYNEKYKEWR